MIAVMAQPPRNHKKKILVVLLHQLDLLRQMWMTLVHMCAIVILSRNRRNGRIGGWGDQILERANVRVVNMNQTVWMDDTTSINNVRMDRRAFRKLCDMLHIYGGLRPSKNMEMDEMVASFLHVHAHHAKNRVVARQLARSGESINRNFNAVLHVVLHLHSILFKKPEPIPEKCINERWKWFKVHYYLD